MIWGIGRIFTNKGSVLLRIPKIRVAKHPHFAFEDGEKVKVEMHNNGKRLVIDKIE